MSAASHLGINLREYDARIRTFIPRYETMLEEAASVIRLVGRSPVVADLGIGTGALSARVLRAAPRSRIIGIDSDDAMLNVARRRLGSRLTTVHGDFERVLGRTAESFGRVRAVDAATASFALHHVRTRARKATLYRHVHGRLRRGGLLVSADCYPASDPRVRDGDREAWLAHLQESYSRRQAKGFFRMWARDDVHFSLEEELRMLHAAGFKTEIRWRVESFAVVLALKG
ncbi:MAG TPA: class I SAM-dependent methyltransferase [Vicinamibacterales bacterium]|jgi:SAM-dependent methyltransferase